jgi:mRNA interferase MazF
MPIYRAWDIVVVPFPFTDQRSTKVRPAVVVSTDILSQRNGKYVLIMVTSASHTAQYGDVPISDLSMAGLPVASVARASKLAVIEEGDMRKRIGTLAKADRLQIAAQLQEFLALKP